MCKILYNSLPFALPDRFRWVKDILVAPKLVLVVGGALMMTLQACGPQADRHVTPVPSQATEIVSAPKAMTTLSEDAAISILKYFLQDCILSWDVKHASLFGDRKMKRGGPIPRGEQRKWLTGVASGDTKDFTWSATYQGMTVAPFQVSKEETWVVIGPGFQRTNRGLAHVPGRWKVWAGNRVAYSLDGPARVAKETYMKPLDTYFDPDCRGYEKR